MLTGFVRQSLHSLVCILVFSLGGVAKIFIPNICREHKEICGNLTCLLGSLLYFQHCHYNSFSISRCKVNFMFLFKFIDAIFNVFCNWPIILPLNWGSYAQKNWSLSALIIFQSKCADFSEAA